MRKFSANIPFELQEEIIQRVPVKSLLRFRCVSKQWKSLIDSPDFSDLRQSQPLLLIRLHDFNIRNYFYVSVANDDTFKSKYKYVSVADDDTLHQHQIPLPKSVINYSRIAGCSHGLFCFYDYDLGLPLRPTSRDKSYSMVVLWNPSIRKTVDVPVPNVLFHPYRTILGFGDNPQTKDPVIVKINNIRVPHIDTPVLIPWRVEVFTLSSRTWKTPSCSINNLPSRNSISFGWSHVALDRVIYWLAFEPVNVDGRFRTHALIMSFDLIGEGFEEICLPGNLARRKSYDLSISKRMESVVVLERDETGTFYCVWMIGQGVTKSFTKLFTVMPRVSPYCLVHGFMKNGEPIVDDGSDSLFAYDPYSKRIKDLAIAGKKLTLSVEPYMETLLLIDQ